jgi:CBS domain-containing protein
MKISDVLASKGRRVETVWPSKRLDQIPQLFDERNISSAVVVDPAGKPLGIITDRLIIHALAKRGASALHLTAEDVMASPLPSCVPEDGVSTALRKMTDERIRHLVVMSGGAMLGIVSIGDLVKIRLQDADLEARVLREVALAHLSTG